MARILVVDDEEGVRSYLAEALALDGHEVVEAEDGHRAHQILERQAFSLMLTDLRMPRMDGMTLVRHARQLAPEMEIIVLTAHGSVSRAVEAMKMGVCDFLTKPIGSPSELRMLVKRSLERYVHRARAEARASTALQIRLTWGAPAMVPVVRALEKVAPTDATVLLIGESGTGKEVAARAIHQQSSRCGGPFVAINCAAIADQLLESELFGHEKGAFTGATERRRGRIELAEGGTFFLDEIGEMEVRLQAKLLRVLQERSFERVGGARTIRANVRWIAATNRDLQAQIADGAFREDLYHRLAVFPLELPSLRERRADIPHLARHLMGRIRRDLGRPQLSLSDEALDKLCEGTWRGNVRELSNALERAAILAEGDRIGPEEVLGHLPARSAPRFGALGTLEELERNAIVRTLEAVDGNRRRTAEILGIGLRTLYDKLKRYDIS